MTQRQTSGRGWRRRVVLSLLLLCGALTAHAQTRQVTALWIWDQQTHVPETTWEIEADGQIVPCALVEAGTVTGEGRCQATVQASTQGYRLRGTTPSPDGPLTGPWSSIATPPGPHMVTALRESEPDAMASFTDDFTRADSDSLGPNWTEVSGDQDIVSNTLSLQTSGFGANWPIYTGVSLEANQYVKATIVTGAASPNFAQFVLRFTDGSSPFYSVEIENENGVTWYRYPSAGGSGTLVEVQALAVANGDAFGLTIDGTGTDTVLRVWKNPTGAAPDSISLWGGASPTLTMTSNPSSPVDSGPHVGLGGFFSGAITFDNFSGGDFAGGGGGVVIPTLMFQYRQRRQ